jgi:hypothetical protein
VFELRALHLQSGALPVKSHLQSILLWLFLEMGSLEFFTGLSLNRDLSYLNVPVARITGVSHWHLAYNKTF